MAQNTFGQDVSQASGSVVPTPPSAVGNNDGPSTATAPTIPVAPSAIASPVTVPPAPTSTSPLATNASIPTPEQIAADTTTPSTTAQAQTGILGKIASLMQGNTSLATLQTNQEATAGVPALTKSVNDLNVQLQGLNDQATSLQNDASAGGTIQNQNQLNATGRGVTSAGLAPITAADLRANQIKQASIASQALTVKSALYAAQGNYTLAKDAADKAAQVQFDHVQQEINYQKSLLDQLTPQLNKEQATQAAVLQAKLNDRSTQIQQQIQNKKDVTAQAIQAMTNNPNDPAAQFAAQQAFKLDPTDPNYTAKAAQLLGKYQANPLDTQLKQAQIRSANTSTALNQVQLNNLASLQSGNLGNYTQTTTNGGKYVNTDNISDAKTQAAVENAARKQGITVLDKNGAAKLQAIDDTRTNLGNIQNTFSQFAYPNAAARDTVGLFGAGKLLKDYFQTDSNISSFKSWRTAAINSIQALAGGSGSGLRINQAEIDAAIHNDIPDITDTTQVGAQKISNLTAQLNSWENELLKPTAGQQAQPSQINYNGKLYNVDPQGNMTPAQ